MNGARSGKAGERAAAEDRLVPVRPPEAVRGGAGVAAVCGTRKRDEKQRRRPCEDAGVRDGSLGGRGVQARRRRAAARPPRPRTARAPGVGTVRTTTLPKGSVSVTQTLTPGVRKPHCTWRVGSARVFRLMLKAPGAATIAVSLKEE